jgi:hypothetical protein
MRSIREPMAHLEQKLSELERDVELAVLITMANLPVADPLANSRFVPEAAVRRLMGSVCSGLPIDEVRRLVARAVLRLQTDGFLEAPSDPRKRWRLTHGRVSR